MDLFPRFHYIIFARLSKIGIRTEYPTSSIPNVMNTQVASTQQKCWVFTTWVFWA